MLRWFTKAGKDAAWSAAEAGDLKALQSALARGADVNWKPIQRKAMWKLARLFLTPALCCYSLA